MPDPTELPLLLTGPMIRRSVIPCGRRTFQRWIAAGTFPRAELRVGSLAYWQRDTVLAWVAQQSAKVA